MLDAIANGELARIGDQVEYEFYGETKRAIVVDINASRTILFLSNGRWIHTISARLV